MEMRKKIPSFPTRLRVKLKCATSQDITYSPFPSVIRIRYSRRQKKHHHYDFSLSPVFSCYFDEISQLDIRKVLVIKKTIIVLFSL